MQSILIVSAAQSYLVLSTKDSIEKMGYNVFLEKPNTNSISKIKSTFSAILLFADEDIIHEKHCLIYLKDKAVEDDVKVFAVGDMDQIKTIEEIIPNHLVQTFLRPVNVKELAESVDVHIKAIGNHIKKKILVVDDSGAMLRSVKSWLSDKYQVILANSGAMAIKYLVQNNPDLILLDYEMPVCDGKQVLEMIRSESEFDDIPVIFLTSKGDKESVMNVMSLKPDGYLLKTMEPKQIIGSIDEFFEKRKAAEL